MSVKAMPCACTADSENPVGSQGEQDGPIGSEIGPAHLSTEATNQEAGSPPPRRGGRVHASSPCRSVLLLSNETKVEPSTDRDDDVIV
ncbi:hypothetical protein J6590_011599 [Homalodisca vitripennis]|nr:hypothetical protein J6590_011599 [Homalodisca vitripennis]